MNQIPIEGEYCGECRLRRYEPKLTSEEEAEFDRMAAIDKHMKKKRFILGGPIDEPKPR
jgi:hypothetical protein